MKKFLTWIFLGYDGTNRSITHWWGYSFGTDTKRGRFSYWLLHSIYSIRYYPGKIKWWAADELGRAAMRLRGEKTTIFGYYDSARGNRAADLCDSLDWDFVMHWDLESDDLWDKRALLEELASLAGATWVRNYEPQKT